VHTTYAVTMPRQPAVAAFLEKHQIICMQLQWTSISTQYGWPHLHSPSHTLMSTIFEHKCTTATLP